ncbi:MAG: hypothetical protein QXW97_00180 [Candidatus Pacearchaeota archaeon]
MRKKLSEIVSVDENKIGNKINYFNYNYNLKEPKITKNPDTIPEVPIWTKRIRNTFDYGCLTILILSLTTYCGYQGLNTIIKIAKPTVKPAIDETYNFFVDTYDKIKESIENLI